MGRYKSYHTTLKLLTKRGTLPQNYSYEIDRSTIWRWKKEPDDKYLGYELSNIEVLEDFISREEAQVLMKTYMKIALSLGTVISSAKTFHKILKDNKSTLINTLCRYKKCINLKLVLRLLNIPASVFHYWKNKVLFNCSTSPIKLCKRIYPHQLTTTEVSVMKELVISDQFKYWPICSIAWHATRENLLHASLATWYKYVRVLGLKSHRVIKKKRYPKGITASAPNEKWHADITIVKTLDGIKNYVYLLMDNYSRYIINWRVEPVVSGKIRVETIKEAYQQNIEGNKNVELIIDGGPENNNGEMDRYLSSETINIRKFIAMKDIPYSNSLIEAQNKLIKYWYLFKCHYNDIDELRKALDWIIADYNNKRPHNSLKGLTPIEAYTGNTYDITAIKIKTEQAKQKRLIENSKNQCEKCK